jgi:hypothetical protein
MFAVEAAGDFFVVLPVDQISFVGHLFKIIPFC